ncbi:PREDICTED: LOW QUALITY PROTEIN: chromatin assembly factor 1 subunit A-B-like [Dufourea novaeangliae]|uniref:LOW QUALITY PROTEIN: chromatin assembly factor 1 subunit A-B-like n=1 Tax=Dufourea novaeangliae TaxID=178035 RepID=UPI0007675857|nr:PREDICTED: LOW QUALITY PROTEIN: chromatin assembly factor 1 subunit A-B-like [Dufourea novaeangliae]
MKMMDIDEQDDCIVPAVTPAKKKMKQAQLPFQTQSPIGSSNVIHSKKRKLTSPSMDLKSPKAFKILRKNLSKDIGSNKKLNSSAKDATEENSKGIEIIDNTETENLKENTTSNKNESGNKNRTPKRISTGQKMLEKDKVKSNPLSKFLKKTEIDGEVSKDERNTLQNEENESVNKSSNTNADKTALQSNHSSQKAEVDNSMNYNSDCDIEILSSDAEDKEELAKSNESGEISGETDSPKSLKTPNTDKGKQRRLTPKQQEKKLSSAKKEEERERLKMEKERKLEERQNRQREKEEKRREKEEKEKAEKEQKMLEKKLKDQKRQQELEQKLKDKQAKEKRLEAKRKKQKAASNFTSFFVTKKQEKTVEEESINKVQNFMPFEVKTDMKVAPVCRRTLTEEEKKALDAMYNKESAETTDLYLSEIKNKKIVPWKSSKTWPFETKDDVILLDDEKDDSSNIVNQNIVIEKQRTKLLQFSENRRPPYWGTWRKRSDSINPRKPLSKDTKWFNYEVDSDDEWDEEEPGESLHGSDDEKDEETTEDNEYDVDNEFMVPHGYLSDEELRADEEDKEDMSPETQKYKLKVLGEQFESDRSTKTSRLKPKIIGCVWRGLENTFSENVPERIVDFLSDREAWVRQIPVALSTTFEIDPGTEGGTPTPQSLAKSSKMSQLPAGALPELIRLLHGNLQSRKFLVREFSAYWNKKNKNDENVISKSSLLRKIREIGKWMACPEEGPMHLKYCWYVPKKIRMEYLDEDISLPNQWSYNLVPKGKRDVGEATEKLDEEKDKKTVPLITNFTKKITQEEMKKQLTVKSSPATPKSKPAKTPKRATLISVGRGEQFSKVSKKNLLKNSISGDKTASKDAEIKNDDDDIVVIESSSDSDQPEIQTVTEEEFDKAENRLVIPVDCENEDDAKSFTKVKRNKSDGKTINNKQKENIKETVIISMDVDSDD